MSDGRLAAGGGSPLATAWQAQLGLSVEEARRRLAQHGRNELPASGRQSGLALLGSVLKEPMFGLLLACAFVYVLLGDVHEALVLASFICVVIVVTFVQEWRTERALSALRDLTSPRALVIRAGEAVRIAGAEVVEGDAMVLREGDRVAADGIVLDCADLVVDESLLTGESMPVRKRAGAESESPGSPGGENLPHVFAGSLVVRGTAVARVTATGLRSQLGRIGRSLGEVREQETLLQGEIRSLVKRLSILGIAFCIVVAFAHGALRGDWLGGMLAGLTLAMALLPEEFPVILTIFYALGAWRLSHRNVLTRRMAAIETLGAVTVLCVDKTGTLTENVMSVQRMQAGECRFDTADGIADLPEEFHRLVEYAILAGRSEPFDPMEIATEAFGRRFLAGTEHLHADWAASREYALSPVLLATARVYRPGARAPYVVAGKGAPEAMIDLCHLAPEEAQAVLADARDFARAGLRVIGVAVADSPHEVLPSNQHDFEFRFLGLIGYADPLRPDVPAAIAECRAAGIRVMMLTGDYPETAAEIARQAGLSAPGKVLTGATLRASSDADLGAAVRDTQVFARVMPDQKLRLVEALLANREVVAMTGDGVNDAPALRRAHVGIAMGRRGTDVAREAAALVITDDNFASIVEAVRQGRRIFANIRKASTYVLAIHLPIAGLTLVPVLLGWPLVLLPFHVAALHLVIDPACSTVLEAEPPAPDAMSTPPRGAATPMLERTAVIWGLVQGLVVLAGCLGLFGWALAGEGGELHARSLAFAALLMVNVGLIVSNRSARRSLLALFATPNPAVRWVVLGVAALLGLLYTNDRALDWFSMAPLDTSDWLVATGGALGMLTAVEAVKIAARPARPESESQLH